MNLEVGKTGPFGHRWQTIQFVNPCPFHDMWPCAAVLFFWVHNKQTFCVVIRYYYFRNVYYMDDLIRWMVRSKKYDGNSTFNDILRNMKAACFRVPTNGQACIHFTHQLCCKTSILKMLHDQRDLISGWMGPNEPCTLSHVDNAC